MIHIFVSPHFDDAILSCGGTIHQLTQSGETVWVMTMMGGLFSGKLPDTPILADLHERWQAGANPLLARQDEDYQAVSSLGASIIHIPLPDCVYRIHDDVPLYPSEESLFGEVHPDDPAPDFLSSIVIPFQDRARTVYIPLGVGHHVDHQIVRDWGLNLFWNRDIVPIKFYAEYPYSNHENSIERALDHFSISLTPNNVILNKDDMTAKVTAIAYYTSQISTFWKSLDAMETDVKQASTHPETGDYVERFWDTTS